MREHEKICLTAIVLIGATMIAIKLIDARNIRHLTKDMLRYAEAHPDQKLSLKFNG